jgi:predicted deacylase
MRIKKGISLKEIPGTVYAITFFNPTPMKFWNQTKVAASDLPNASNANMLAPCLVIH